MDRVKEGVSMVLFHAPHAEGQGEREGLTQLYP